MDQTKIKRRSFDGGLLAGAVTLLATGGYRIWRSKYKPGDEFVIRMENVKFFGQAAKWLSCVIDREIAGVPAGCLIVRGMSWTGAGKVISIYVTVTDGSTNRLVYTDAFGIFHSVPVYGTTQLDNLPFTIVGR